MLSFLITDIESSTEKWSRYGEAMGNALARHNEILKTAILENGGKIVKNTGDGVISVFEDVGEETCNPLQCALDIQKKLSEEKWPEIEELRVRIAIHSGNAMKRGDDYFGPVVNETARLLDAAWGGQILLSRKTLENCRIPPCTELSDQGIHQLRGISESQQIYSLLHANLPLNEFPPLRNVSTYPNNLPQQPTRFIGRKSELLEIHRLLKDESCRLLTLLGVGGVGKTRIALQTAQDNSSEYPHGVWFVALAPLSSVESIILTIASALKLNFYSSEDPEKQLLEYLRDKRMLLLMDNFEHLVEGADIIKQILQYAPKVTILVTSRERLNLRDEWIFDIQGLNFPGKMAVGETENDSALELFASSASKVKKGFGITDRNRSIITEICRLLDGLPLGIEIAASWLRVLDLEEITGEIAGSFDFLESTLRDLPERHRSLERVFEYSWKLLSTEERKVLAALSVFRGGFTKYAAETVSGASVQVLSSFINKSLVFRISTEQFERNTTNSPALKYYFDMHESVRQFAFKKLLAMSSESSRIRQKHCFYYADLLQRMKKDLKGIDRNITLTEVEIELENLHAAWHWALGNENIESIDRLFEGLNCLYNSRGWLRDAVRLFSEALRKLKPAEDCYANTDRSLSSIIGKIMLQLSWLKVLGGDYANGGEELRESLEIFRYLGDKSSEALALNRLGSLALFGGDFERSRLLQENSLNRAKESDNLNTMARTFMSLGNISRKSGDYTEAENYYRECLRLYKTSDNFPGQAICLGNLGIVAFRTGNLEEALRLDRESQALSEVLGDRRMVAEGLTDIGNVLKEMGNTEAAWEHYNSSLSMNRELGLKGAIVITLENMGTLAAEDGDFEKAEAFLSEALELSRKMGRRVMIVELLTRFGRISMECGDSNEAERRFKEALSIAKNLRVVPSIITLLTGILELLVKLDNRDLTDELVDFILSHPITSDEIFRKVTESLRKSISEKLPVVRNEESTSFGKLAERMLEESWNSKT